MLRVDELQILQQFGVVPISIATLTAAFSTYKAPEKRIQKMESEGDLVRLKKGMYVVAAKYQSELLSQELIANHLYGPSYISTETALSYYGIIPERVYTITSVTLKRANKFETPQGLFTYTTAPPEYYPIGIQINNEHPNYCYLIASPEKALCDLIMFSLRTRIRSLVAMRNYIESDMRMDLSAIGHWDVSIIDECIQTGRKVAELNYLKRIIQDEYI